MRTGRAPASEGDCYNGNPKKGGPKSHSTFGLTLRAKCGRTLKKYATLTASSVFQPKKPLEVEERVHSCGMSS